MSRAQHAARGGAEGAVQTRQYGRGECMRYGDGVGADAQKHE